MNDIYTMFSARKHVRGVVTSAVVSSDEVDGSNLVTQAVQAGT